MFLLSFVPDTWLYFAVLFVLTAGVSLYSLSFVTKFVPPLIPYSGIVRIIGTLLMVAGVYFYGGYSTEMDWRGRVADLEKKVAVAEQKSKEANVQLDSEIKKKTKVIKEVQVVIQERIKQVEKQIDAECKLDPQVISILNDAAKPVKKK